MNLPSLHSSSNQVRSRPRGLWKESHGLKQGLDLNHELRAVKRQRSEDTSSDDGDFEGYYLLEYSPEPVGSECSDMDTSEPPLETESLEDWEDLKELFTRATEEYESDNVNEALSLLRDVIHESARFMLLYEDPSMLFAEPRRTCTPEPALISTPTTPKKKMRITNRIPFAPWYYSFFLFGNLIAQEPSFAVPNEPSLPATYWLAALDVFETGENLPSRTSGRGCEAPEDWRMAIVWGRTLLCVADAALTFQQQGPDAPPLRPEPKWPSPTASPFAAIAMRRPPGSRRIVLETADPHDLLLLAMDHFTRGIFHMPHTPPLPAPGTTSVSAFNRASELFTIARETRSRVPGGRCWLVVGTARVEDIEAMAEARGWGEGEEGSESQYSSALDSEEAEEAREGLERAVEFFERAKGVGTEDMEIADERRAEGEELRAFLVEALLTLANFTKEEDKREALYGRAQLLGGDTLEGMEVDGRQS
ncbi:hypothetical protein MVEN_01030000 [Mycena venus]|uniref:Uncharacterized protein n=1 Tax=Mycena venus TaxID=2733690 RepID=A0A8H6Y9M6_9AGAR|nr:hypothetical protein MVEN_01030000 [Mycena venus]